MEDDLDGADLDDLDGADLNVLHFPSTGMSEPSVSQELPSTIPHQIPPAGSILLAAGRRDPAGVGELPASIANPTAGIWQAGSEWAALQEEGGEQDEADRQMDPTPHSRVFLMAEIPSLIIFS